MSKKPNPTMQACKSSQVKAHGHCAATNTLCVEHASGGCGYANRDAVEIYPTDADVVNVANMRHLWVLAAPMSFAWRKP